MARKILGLNLVFLLAGAAGAQDRHVSGSGGSSLAPPQRSAPRIPPPGRGPRGGFPIAAGYWGGYGYGGYGYGGYEPVYPDTAPVVNNIVFQPPPVFVPPPPPIRSSIQAFAPVVGNEPSSLFVIALKNGTRLDAAAVWVQGNDLHYVDADDQNRRLPLSDVDRKATRELNQARNLNLRLPPPAQ